MIATAIHRSRWRISTSSPRARADLLDFAGFDVFFLGADVPSLTAADATPSSGSTPGTVLSAVHSV